MINPFRFSQSVLLVALWLLVSQMAAADETIEAAKQYAAQPHHCGLDHGYQCRDSVESDFNGLKADQQMVPGNYLAAWQSAIADFLSIEELSDQQKSLQHYKFGFSENPQQYVVHFQPLLLPRLEQGQPTGILRGAIGRATRYWINKQTLEIDQRLFYK